MNENLDPTDSSFDKEDLEIDKHYAPVFNDFSAKTVLISEDIC